MENYSCCFQKNIWTNINQVFLLSFCCTHFHKKLFIIYKFIHNENSFFSKFYSLYMQDLLWDQKTESLFSTSTSNLAIPFMYALSFLRSLLNPISYTYYWFSFRFSSENSSTEGFGLMRFFSLWSPTFWVVQVQIIAVQSQD